MKTALILDAGCDYHGGGGSLNHSYTALAVKILQEAGWQTMVTRVEDEWNREAEAERLKAADLVIVQTPIWSMAPPWQFKRWQDEIVCLPGLYTDDGRSHANPDVNYGRGGLLKGRYLLSTTWNAPLNAFTAPEEFFEGKGIDVVMLPVHKAMQFMGLTPLPTFMANDVVKNPTFEEDFRRFEVHLTAALKEIAE